MIKNGKSKIRFTTQFPESVLKLKTLTPSVLLENKKNEFPFAPTIALNLP